MKTFRRKILEAANQHRRNEAAKYGQYEPLTMRNIQRAVFICVQRRLVSPATLKLAGYRGAAVRLERRLAQSRA